MQVGLGPGHIVLGGDPASPPQRGRAPPFLAHICCGRIAGWIEIPLGMEVGLGTGDFVLDGDPAPLPKRGAEPPPLGNFRPMFIVSKPAGYIKPALGMKVGLVSPGDFVLDGDQPPSPKSLLPNFLSCLSSLSVTLVYCGQTVERIKIQETQLSLRDRATRACQLKSGKVLHKCRRLVFEKL